MSLMKLEVYVLVAVTHDNREISLTDINGVYLDSGKNIE